MSIHRGLVYDVVAGKAFPGEIEVKDGKISLIAPCPDAPTDRVICPGLIDSHVHIESSLVSPAQFGRAACVHGTVATVSDPHEMANVLGIPGIRWMSQNGKTGPIKIFFGAPPCVPATTFETAGASFSPVEIEQLLQDPETEYLGEFMNYPGVIHKDPSCMAMIESAKKYNKPIDGHAPMLAVDDLQKYLSAGITTDHECPTVEDAQNHLRFGCKILIRNGSAATDFDSLLPILLHHTDQCMFASDDKHPATTTASLLACSSWVTRPI